MAGEYPGRVGVAATWGKTCANFSVPKDQNTVMIPRAKPKSPIRLTTKALIAAALGGRPLVPEADQQIARQPDPFPAEEQLHEVGGGDQRQHGRR